MNKLEQAAKAHHESDLAVTAGIETPWDRLPEGVKQQKRNAMRAALAVLREPDEAMLDAGLPVAWEGNEIREPWCQQNRDVQAKARKQLRLGYTAMIDAVEGE